MSITFACSCGHTLTVPESKAGATGKCPRCSAAVHVPALVGAAAASSPAVHSGLEIAEASAPPTALKSAPPCPQCGTRYEPDVVVCIACGLNLITGQPLGSGVSRQPFSSRHTVAHDDTEAETMGFWKMTLGVLLKPLQTMELFGTIFARQDMLAKGVVFYAASFIAVALAAAFAASPDRNAEVQHQISEIERVNHVKAVLPKDWVDVKSSPQGLTEWGEALSYRLIEPLGPIEAGKPFTVRLQVMEPGRTQPALGKAKMGRTRSHGNPPGDEWYEMKKGATDGEWVAELPAGREGSSSFMFSLTCRPGTQAGDLGCARCGLHFTWTHLPGWGRLVLDDRQERLMEAAKSKGIPLVEEKKSGGLLGAALGTAGMFAAIAVNVVGLLISAAIFTGAARLLGGGGGFLLMLVTMAYLTGFSNFLQFFTLLTPLKLQIWLQAALLFYGLGLQLFALMKVYDIDILQALMTAILGTVAKVFGAAFLVLAVLKVLGMA